MPTATRLEWRRREPPLPTAAVAASGLARGELAAATARRLDRGALLRAVAGNGWLVVLAAEDDLPWAEGATYLGWDRGLLVPTTLIPTTPADLLRRTLGGSSEQLVIVLPGAILTSAVPQSPAASDRLLAECRDR